VLVEVLVLLEVLGLLEVLLLLEGLGLLELLVLLEVLGLLGNLKAGVNMNLSEILVSLKRG